jgi:hypothetical protein
MPCRAEVFSGQPEKTTKSADGRSLFIEEVIADNRASSPALSKP